MMMQRSAAKNAPPRPTMNTDLQNHAERLDHEHPADDRQQHLLSHDDGHQSEHAPQGQRAGIAHEHLRRMTIEPQKSQDAADQAAGDDDQFAGAGQMGQVEIGRPLGMAGGISDRADCAGGREQAAPGQAVESIGEIHRVRRADDHQDRQRHEQPSQLADATEQRQHQIQSARLPALHSIEQQRRDQRHDGLTGQLGPRRQSGTAAGELDEIVGGADGGQTHQGDEDDRNVMIAQVAQEHGCAEQAGDEEQAPHRRRPLLVPVQFEQFGRGRDDGLAKAAIEPSDQPRSQDERRDEADPGGQRRANRDLAECSQVGAVDFARRAVLEPTEQPDEHENLFACKGGSRAGRSGRAAAAELPGRVRRVFP